MPYINNLTPDDQLNRKYILAYTAVYAASKIVVVPLLKYGINSLFTSDEKPLSSYFEDNIIMENLIKTSTFMVLGLGNPIGISNNLNFIATEALGTLFSYQNYLDLLELPVKLLASGYAVSTYTGAEGRSFFDDSEFLAYNFNSLFICATTVDIAGHVFEKIAENF